MNSSPTEHISACDSITMHMSIFIIFINRSGCIHTGDNGLQINIIHTIHKYIESEAISMHFCNLRLVELNG